MGIASALVGIAYLALKLIFWQRFTAGMAPMLIGVFFLGAVQLFFMGFMGKYILSINQRVMNRPLVVEEERINFEEPDEMCQRTVDKNKKAGISLVASDIFC